MEFKDDDDDDEPLDVNGGEVAVAPLAGFPEMTRERLRTSFSMGRASVD